MGSIPAIFHSWSRLFESGAFCASFHRLSSGSAWGDSSTLWLYDPPLELLRITIPQLFAFLDRVPIRFLFYSVAESLDYSLYFEQHSPSPFKFRWV